MNYHLNQLRIFLKVTQTQSITKAAAELHLTQPAVSIQLKNFQEQFDLPLTEIVGRKLYVTDFGKEVARTVEQIMEGINTLNYRTLAHKGLLTGKLKISIVSTGKYVMPYLLSDFLKRHRGIELSMDVTNIAGVTENLQNNEVDFSLVSSLPEGLTLDHLKLMPNKFYMVASREKSFDKKTLNHSIIEQMPLIYREQGSATRELMEQYIKANKIRVGKKMVLTSNEAVKQAVMAGLGSSIMPIFGIKNELNNKQLQIVPIKNFPIKTNWYLIWQKNKKFSSAAAAYLEYLKKEKENIIQRKFGWVEKY